MTLLATIVLIGSCASRNFRAHADTSILAQVTDDVVMDGTIEVLIEDSAQSSRTLYFLIAGERRVPLRFLKTPVNLMTGVAVRVHGRWDDSVLVVASFERI